MIPAICKMVKFKNELLAGIALVCSTFSKLHIIEVATTHAHIFIKLTKQMQMVGGHTSDTITIYKKKSTSLCSSTPKQLRNLCYHCKNYLFEMFMEGGT